MASVVPPPIECPLRSLFEQGYHCSTIPVLRALGVNVEYRCGPSETFPANRPDEVASNLVLRQSLRHMQRHLASPKLFFGACCGRCVVDVVSLAPTNAAERQCLDAFTVNSSQAYDGGGEKRWHAPALEPQLTSLEICGAGRGRVPVLHGGVGHRTPCSLWSPREAETAPGTPTSPGATGLKKFRSPSRVPIVRVFRVTWALPVEVLAEGAAAELLASPVVLHLQGAVSIPSLQSVTSPRGLRQL